MGNICCKKSQGTYDFAVSPVSQLKTPTQTYTPEKKYPVASPGHTQDKDRTTHHQRVEPDKGCEDKSPCEDKTTAEQSEQDKRVDKSQANARETESVSQSHNELENKEQERGESGEKEFLPLTVYN